MPTIGEQRVRAGFNPSEDAVVYRIKARTADLIDECQKLKEKDPRLAALAQTAYEEAAMWAVKAATAGGESSVKGREVTREVTKGSKEWVDVRSLLLGKLMESEVEVATAKTQLEEATKVMNQQQNAVDSITAAVAVFEHSESKGE